MTTPSSDVRTGPLAEGDIDDVWAFFDALPEGDRTFVKEPVATRATVAGWLDGDTSLRQLARAGGDIVGYVAVVPGVGWSRHVGELRLVVAPDRRRQGIGQLLARHALGIAVQHGLTKVVVEVVADQESTIGLFTGLGFRAEALLVDQVQDPDGRYGDLIVLANRTDTDWRLLTTVGLDEPLD